MESRIQIMCIVVFNCWNKKGKAGANLEFENFSSQYRFIFLIPIFIKNKHSLA